MFLCFSYQPEKSVWKNFKGITVTSKPALRFFKSGIDDIETETAFAVIEVTNFIMLIKTFLMVTLKTLYYLI